MKRIYYFGCIGEPGHYLWLSPREKWNQASKTVTSRLHVALDSAFCPPEDWPNGRIMESWVPPWIILSWWDNSIDTRPGSHSTFLIQGGIPDFWNNWEAVCKAAFPEVFARFKYPLVRGPYPYTRP